MARAPSPRHAPRQPSPGLQQARGQHRDALDKIKVREFYRAPKRDDMTDDVLGLKRNRVIDEIGRKLAQERGKPAKRMADLKLPAARNVRPSTIDGRTSFHFSHEAVSKTRNNIEKDSGLKIGPGAARKHGKYIERDGAVAAMNDKEKAELEKLLDSHPELEAGESSDGMLTIEKRTEAALHGYYVERQEALATQPDGEKVLFTNISPDSLERARVWDKIEEFERNPSPDELIINVGKHQAFWDRVKDDPDLPQSLSDALMLAEPDRPYRFQTDDARSSLRWLREQPDWDKEDPAVIPKLGEGGRIQYRMIGELPHELDLRGRTAILAEFAHEFEKRKLPYVAVMHAPDHANDDRNWHFHLIYYDRPIEKMADGRWDFEVEETFKRSNRMTRSNFPHRQEKVKEVNEKTWIPKMRKRLAEITNDHMQMAGIGRRVDPRRYSEMGIHREAQEHLGTRAAALESMGVATPAGYRNANKEWDAVFADVERRREAEQKKTDLQARRFHDRIDRNFRDDPNENKALHTRVERWRQSRDEASEYTSYVTSIHKNHERLTSRAEKVNKTCEKQIEAAKKGFGSNFKRSDAIHISKRQIEALNEVRDATQFMRPMLDAAVGWAKTADLLRAQAAREEREIELKLGSSSADTSDKAREIKNRRDREDGTFQGQDGEYRRALNKAEMDAWVESIRTGHRRLVAKDRRFEPLTTRPGDEKYLEAGNYGVMTPRLSGIKAKQDKVISEVVAYVEKNPHAVMRERNEQGEAVLSLRVSRPQWQSAFKDYADDPDMRKASLDALAVRDGVKAGRATTPERTSEPRTAGAPATARSEPVGRAAEPAGQADQSIERALARLSREAVRLRETDGVFGAEAKALASIGMSAKDLEPAFVQDRLRGIHRQQQSDIVRLTTFVEKHPYAIVQKEGRYQLGPKSPPALVAIAQKWIADDELQASLKATSATTRSPARNRQERPVEKTSDAAPVRTPAEPRTPVAEPADAPRPAEPARRPAEPSVPGPAAPAVEVPRQPAVERTAVERPVVPTPEPTARPEMPTPAIRPETPAPVEAGTRTSEPRHPDGPPARVPAEPVAETPTPAVPGAPVEPKAPVERRPEPAQANLFGDDVDSGRASGQAVFEKQRPDLVPLRRDNAAVDAWMKAGEQEASLADRRRLAADLARDKAALSALASTDPELARQLQIDADTHRRLQGKGHGLGRGRGIRPKR